MTRRNVYHTGSTRAAPSDPGDPDCGDDTMAVSITSPDQNIHIRILDISNIKLWFRSRSFDRYDEERLAHQLGRLGSTAWITYHRRQSEAYRRAQGLSADELAAAERPSDSPHRRRFQEALHAVEGEGVSPSGAIRVRTTGLLRWNVTIEPGTLRRLGEDRFRSEVHATIRALLQDREMKIIILKSDYFDLGLPDAWLDLMRRLRASNSRR
ncbi:MAG: hypothetical protein HKP61_12355 [Dactylosporangium sp.]|nr:hypothetical protein [Dactylosporangium sp.]NNJ61711.1 hypothetical protein [Dactylosporangium sp.]